MYCHVDILENNGLWTMASSVKGQEAEFLVSYNLIGVRPFSKAALRLDCRTLGVGPHNLIM